MKTPVAIGAAFAFAALIAACSSTQKPGGVTGSAAGGEDEGAMLNRFSLPTVEQMKTEPRPGYDAAGRPLAATIRATATKEWSQEKQLQAGVQWLLDNQQEDGHWGHFLPRRPGDIYLGGLNSLHAFGNASTGLCCMALLLQTPTPEINQAIVRGYEYLAKSAPLARRIKGDTFYSVWAHTYMVEAFCRAFDDTRVKDLVPAMRKRAQEELNELVTMQMCDGGFGYYDFGENYVHPSSEQSTSFNAAAALVAVKLARAAKLNVPESFTEGTVRTLARMRLPNGAYAYSRDWVYRPVTGPSTIEGSLCRATAGNYALHMYGRDVKVENVKAGLDNLFNHHDYVEIARQRQYPHETWFQNAPYYYYFGHYYAALSLDDLKTEDRADYAGKLALFVGITQDADGSFWDYPLYGYTKAYGTAYGVLVLSTCKRHQTAGAPAVVVR